MLVVQLLGVLKIDLENVADLSVWSPPLDLVKRWKDKTPCEISNRERLTHGPAVEIVRVVIHDVARLLLGVVVAEVAVVCLAEAPALHGYATSQASFDKEVLVDICEQFQVDTRVLEEGVPGKTGACVVMRRVEFVVLQACLSEVFENVNQE